jgi:hypothetical protein
MRRCSSEGAERPAKQTDTYVISRTTCIISSWAVRGNTFCLAEEKIRVNPAGAYFEAAMCQLPRPAVRCAPPVQTG